MDYRLAMMCGSDIPFAPAQIVIHQPRINEISMIGETDFFIGTQCLTLHKSMFTQGKDDLAQITNFQIFMKVMAEKEARDKKLATTQVLSVLFPKYKVMLTPNSVILQDGNDMRMIDKDNFDDFQDTLRMIFCSKNGPMDQQAFNPAGDKAKEIAQKLMRGRQRVAAQNKDAGGSTFAQYLSILAIGMNSMSLQDLQNLTMFQIYDLLERYNLYVNWDLDVRTRLAGGKPDKGPENWMKNLH